MILDERRTYSQAFLLRTTGDQTDGRDTVIHQLVSQLTRRHTRITDGEIETVSNRFVEVLVIHHIEVMAAEDLLQFLGPLTIDRDFLAEVVTSLIGGSQHGGHRILGTVARTGTQGVEHTGGEDRTERQTLVPISQILEMTMEQGIRDTRDTDTLTGIAESLRTADEQHIVVGIAGNGSLIRWLERCGEILTEVHREICEVFHHDDIVFRRQLTDHLQLLLTQTDPRRIIGVGIDDGTDVSLREITLELCSELVTTIVIDIEGLILHTHHLQLHLLYGEAGIDEEDGILLLVTL